MLPIALATFSFALWLGLYLLARDRRQPPLRYAALGLVGYTLSIGGALLREAATTSAQSTVAGLLLTFLFLPPLFWSATILFMLPGDDPLRQRLGAQGHGAVELGAALLYLLALGSDGWRRLSTAEGSPSLLYGAITGLMALLLLAALLLAVRAYRRTTEVKRTVAWLVVATLFFALGSGLLILPFNWLPPDLLLLAIAPDLLLLGVAVAFVDAFTGGEALWPDLWRSFSYAGLTAAVFAAQIALVMWLATGVTFAMLALLLVTISTAIVLATFAADLSAVVDRFVLSRFPPLLREWRRLQTESAVALRRDRAVDPLALPEEEFARLTRRAFSHMGNLSRLASSPLTRLPQVEGRLQARGRADTSLERAQALRQLLSESVQRLKPRGPELFSSGDAWRFYNALYFPYIAGLKPYSRRAGHGNLSQDEKRALDWFRREVPQRTLYNWQTTAAELVAKDLRQRSPDSP